jgi:[FeFe] hydrogenase H-cluster maturation GTPase HydF
MEKGRENKPHIGIFGRRNFGKSALINTMVGQNIAIVSEHPGTTTDPVKKSIEIPGIGPAIIIDTAGIDDTGTLGDLRVQKTKEIYTIIDLALIVLNGNEITDVEISLLDELYDSGIPFLFVHNKEDIDPLKEDFKGFLQDKFKVSVISFSALKPHNLNELFHNIVRTMPETAYHKQSMLGNLISYGDIVLLITPIDTEAPEGRLILPQVQAIRDILDNDCIAVVLKEREVDGFLRKTGIKPKLAVCDTSVVLKADASLSSDIPLTGFSILLARFKGEFEYYRKGTPEISKLKNGDRVLMLESCTHHLACDDIGRVKIPRWMSSFTGKELHFDVVAGLNQLSRPVTDYALVIQCGGCMITRKQLTNRLKPAIDAGIPVTNYGMAIAWIQGVYDRVMMPFN